MTLPPSANMPHDQQGASLLELLIAMTIGLLVVAGVVMLYMQTSRAFVQQHAMADLQARGRLATQLISEELRRTGFWGEMALPERRDSDSTALDGTAFDVANILPVWGGSTKTAEDLKLLPESADLVASTVQAPSSVVAVRYADHGNGPCIALNSQRQLVTEDACSSNWRYHAAIYHLRWVTEPTGEQVPALYVSLMGKAEKYIGSEVVRHVEAFEIEWGRDEDGDGSANRFYNSSDVSSWIMGDWDRVVVARIYLLLRSEKMALPMPARKFLMAGRIVEPAADHYQRRLFVTTATLRNNRLRMAHGH